VLDGIKVSERKKKEKERGALRHYYPILSRIQESGHNTIKGSNNRNR
jgi:hypothetical protein